MNFHRPQPAKAIPVWAPGTRMSEGLPFLLSSAECTQPGEIRGRRICNVIGEALWIDRQEWLT